MFSFACGQPRNSHLSEHFLCAGHAQKFSVRIHSTKSMIMMQSLSHALYMMKLACQQSGCSLSAQINFHGTPYALQLHLTHSDKVHASVMQCCWGTLGHAARLMESPARVSWLLRERKQQRMAGACLQLG